MIYQCTSKIHQSEVEDYLKLGESLEIHKRYKCQRRKNWYVVPKVPPGEGFSLRDVMSTLNCIKIILRSLRLMLHITW
ncbi:hypothetical protein [Klebsiella pneumoniae]|uniref:hypothetical protein n=1 Tax=Klebsiella pneumoniae TaxID=573 RepID=UPI003D3027B6